MFDWLFPPKQKPDFVRFPLPPMRFPYWPAQPYVYASFLHPSVGPFG